MQAVPLRRASRSTSSGTSPSSQRAQLPQHLQQPRTGGALQTEGGTLVAEKAKLWVRAEPFDFAVVQSPPPQRLTYQAIRKLCVAVRTKSHESQSDWLSFPLWRSFVINKLQVAEELAWAYFESFHTLTEAHSTGLAKLTDQFAECKSEDEKEALRRQTKVFLPKFVLFLVLQTSAHMSSLRSLSAQDVALGSRGPPVPSAVPKVTEEYLHIQFIKKELPQLLSLLLAPEAMSGGAATLVDSVVPETSVEAMSFLMEGTSDDRRILPVADLARLQTQTTESGYSKITRTFSLAKLQAWIFSLLSTNPFGVDMCIAKRRHTPSVVAPTLPPVHVQPLLIGKTASNRVYAPESRSLVLFSQVTGQTLVRDAGDIGGSGILIKRCHNSTIYLLAPIRFVRVERCNNTVLVLGTVQQFVKLCHCRNVRVYTVTRQLHISDCSDTTIYACTSNRPLLLYGNSNLTLAPYGTAYDNLTADMTTTGLRVTPNVWDQPLCTGTTAATAAVKRNSSSSSGNEATRSPSPSQPKCYRLMDPAEYFDFSIPFEQAGELTRGKLRPGLQYPIPLPMAFKQAKAARQRSILEATKSIRRGLEGVSQERSTAYVQASKEIFTEWLRDNGYQREIDALGALQMVTSQP